MYVDIDARISELGRQPYSARRFLIKYQDRVLFGTDTTPEPQRPTGCISGSWRPTMSTSTRPAAIIARASG